MSNPLDPVIEAVDHMDNGIVIRFRDGNSAFYSASMLHQMLPQAKTMPHNDDLIEDVERSGFFEKPPGDS